MASLSIKKLYKSYGDIAILNDINVEARDGEFLVLLGPSGCGKSTLLSAIAGLDDITDGDILIDDESVEGLEPKDRDIAMVFQSYALYPTMTVRKNIEFGMKVRGVSVDERKKAIERVADTLQIQTLLDRKPSQLSGGQRQRVAIGRALVRSPKIFLFDEPLSNLDAKLRADMRAEIKRLHQRLQATIVYVTHDQVEAMTLATKIVILKSGVVQQIGSPEEIYEKPVNTYVAGFIGSPPMNLIPAKYRHDRNGSWLEFANEHGPASRLNVANPRTSSDLQDGQSVLAGVRPEAISLPGDSGSGAVQEIEATIELIEPTGSDTFADLQIGGHPLIARLRSKAPISLGRATFCVETSAIQIFNQQTGLRIEQVEEHSESTEQRPAGKVAALGSIK